MLPGVRGKEGEAPAENRPQENGEVRAGSAIPGAVIPEGFAVQFRGLSEAVGLDLKNVLRGTEQEYIIEFQSTGSAFLDYDGDGFLERLI